MSDYLPASRGETNPKNGRAPLAFADSVLKIQLLDQRLFPIPHGPDDPPDGGSFRGILKRPGPCLPDIKVGNESESIMGSGQNIIRKG